MFFYCASAGGSPSHREFHALFITQANSPIKSLPDLKGKSFAFGEINSTSGHLIPYRATQHAGVNPDKDFKFRYTGSHAATVKAAESGAVDAQSDGNSLRDPW